MSARRILKPSTIICIALGVLLLIYVRPLTLLSTVRWKTRAKPEFWIVPRPLADVSIEQTAGRNFTFYGYQFKVLTSGGTENEAGLKRLFGEEATRPNYALRSKILNLTPSDLHLSLSRQKMVS